MDCRITHLGTATVLLEIGSLRLLTDPVLDPPGRRYDFGWGTASTKTGAPHTTSEEIGRIDAVLLSHDQHGDNLDDGGRALLPRAKQVLTTRQGARRLGGRAVGLRPWDQADIVSEAGERLRVTATPARHGPWIVRPFVGQVIGFLLEWEGQEHGALYITGDTVLFPGVAEVARRHRVGTALLHLGGVGFKITGPVRYTLTGQEAVRLSASLGARTLIPIHYEGWTHFKEPRSAAEKAFRSSGVGDRVRWLEPGVPYDIDM